MPTEPGPTGAAPATYEIAGRTVTMPCLVRDASAGTAMFDVDLAAARALIPAPFVPVETSPGRCQLVLAVIDCRDLRLRLLLRALRGVAGHDLLGHPARAERLQAHRQS